MAPDPRSPDMSNAVTAANTVVISFLPVPVVEDNKATRELAKADAIRTVNAALVDFDRAARMAAWG